MAISLSKGQKVDLTKTNPGLDNVVIGLGWDTNRYDGGHQFDLDSSVFLVGSDSKVLNEKSFIYFNNQVSENGSVKHNGDNLTGAGEGDDETVDVTLSQVPADVQKVIFTITIHEADVRNQNFGQVDNSFVRVYNKATNEELIRYDLNEDFSIETAIVVGELYRHGGEWKFAAVGSGFQGGLAALATSFGLQVQ